MRRLRCALRGHPGWQSQDNRTPPLVVSPLRCPRCNASPDDSLLYDYGPTVFGIAAGIVALMFFVHGMSNGGL